MAECELECSDVFDQRRFYSETIAILRALLGSTATTDTEIRLMYDVQPDGTYIPFYQIITVTCDGTIEVSNVELDGTTEYTPTGIVSTAATQQVVSMFADITGDTIIPAGFVQAGIAIQSGTADIDGVTFPEGTSIKLPPMSFGSIDRLYPELAITNVTGHVFIHYNTLV